MCHEIAAGDMSAFASDQDKHASGYLLELYTEFEDEVEGEGGAGPDCMGVNSVGPAPTAVEGGVAWGADGANPDSAKATGAAVGQGGQQVTMCPQEAQLNTVWTAAVSVAISRLHAIAGGRQKTRECAKELDCIAKQNPRLLFFAVVCPEAGRHLNGQLRVGGAPNSVVLISMDGLVGELAQGLSLQAKQFYHFLHEMHYPHGIELAVLTRHLPTACANFPGMFETLNINHLLFADTNDFFTPEGINKILGLRQPFVQLIDGSMGGKDPARVLGGGLRMRAPNVRAYGDALRLTCQCLFKGYKALTSQKFETKFRQNFHAHPLVLSGSFTFPEDLTSRLPLDQIVQRFALGAVATPERYTEIVVD